MIQKSDIFIILAALISLGLSAFLWFSGQADEALFTGVWVPSILGFGIYFKAMGLRARR